MQKDFYSNLNKKVLDKQSRRLKADQIIKIIRPYIKKDPKSLKVLDLGCSSGVISFCLAEFFGKVIAIDIDQSALEIAKKENSGNNLSYYSMDASSMKFKNDFFDIVIANQLYYYFKDQSKLFAEIYRVLKPGGLCFLSGTNKYAILKPKEPVKCYYKSFWELKRLSSKFAIRFQTWVIASMQYKLLKFVPSFVSNLLEPFMPNFIWVLEKKPK